LQHSTEVPWLSTRPFWSPDRGAPVRRLGGTVRQKWAEGRLIHHPAIGSPTVNSGGVSADSVVDHFESDRHFQLWRYSVSMGQLLLRSNRDGEHATRVEVFFQNVSHLDIPTHMDGLRVDKDAGGRYRLTGDGWSGSVDAGIMKSAEDHGSYVDPSPLFIGGF
jgi:hypothetical protein